MADEKELTVNDLIMLLQKFPQNTKVFINGEIGWYPLREHHVISLHTYIIWHSDYNGNGLPYVDHDYEPKNFVYPREPYMGHPRPDYVCKTLGEEDIIILG